MKKKCPCHQPLPNRKRYPNPAQLLITKLRGGERERRIGREGQVEKDIGREG